MKVGAGGGHLSWGCCPGRGPRAGRCDALCDGWDVCSPPDVFAAPAGREEEGGRSDAQDGAGAAGPGAGPSAREVAELESRWGGDGEGTTGAGGRCGLCQPARPGWSRGKRPAACGAARGEHRPLRRGREPGSVPVSIPAVCSGPSPGAGRAILGRGSSLLLQVRVPVCFSPFQMERSPPAGLRFQRCQLKTENLTQINTLMGGAGV